MLLVSGPIPNSSESRSSFKVVPAFKEGRAVSCVRHWDLWSGRMSTCQGHHHHGVVFRRSVFLLGYGLLVLSKLKNCRGFCCFLSWMQEEEGGRGNKLLSHDPLSLAELGQEEPWDSCLMLRFFEIIPGKCFYTFLPGLLSCQSPSVGNTASHSGTHGSSARAHMLGIWRRAARSSWRPRSAQAQPVPWTTHIFSFTKKQPFVSIFNNIFYSFHSVSLLILNYFLFLYLY